MSLTQVLAILRGVPTRHLRVGRWEGNNEVWKGPQEEGFWEKVTLRWMTR